MNSTICDFHTEWIHIVLKFAGFRTVTDFESSTCIVYPGFSQKLHKNDVFRENTQNLVVVTFRD